MTVVRRDSRAEATANVLLVDGDAAERDAIASAFRGASFEVRADEDGTTLGTVLLRFSPDLAIIEVRPRIGPDGYVMARILIDHDVPVILLATTDRLEDRLACFHAGADDCLGRPLSPTELLARATAVLRRAGRLHSPVLRYDDVVVNERTRRVTRFGYPVELTRTEFDLLCALLRRPDRVVSKRQLLANVWGTNQASDNVVEVHIKALRRKLEEHGPRIIDTVRGVGYICRQWRAMAPSVARQAGRRPNRTRYPLTIENCGSIETFVRPPTRVLTEGAPPTTALLVQLGLKERILKAAIYSTRSDVPGLTAELASLDRVRVPRPGHPEGLGLRPNELAALGPDLVIGAQDSYFRPEQGYASRAELHAAGIQAYAPSFLRSWSLEDPDPELVVADQRAGIDAHLQTILELGRIFDVGERADHLVGTIREAIERVQAKVAHLTPMRVAITDPFTADTAAWPGVFHVYCGQAVDELLVAVGAVNVWSNAPGSFQSVPIEVAADRPADVVVFGTYDVGPSADEVVSYLQATFPAWPAVRERRFVELADSAHFQITNPTLVSRLARALHPQAFGPV